MRIGKVAYTETADYSQLRCLAEVAVATPKAYCYQRRR
jgi:hypothetical protein